MEYCTLRNGAGPGIDAEIGSNVGLSHSVLHNNVDGVLINSGTVLSDGTNTFLFNSTDVSGGTLTPLALQ